MEKKNWNSLDGLGGDFREKNDGELRGKGTFTSQKKGTPKDLLFDRKRDRDLAETTTEWERYSKLEEGKKDSRVNGARGWNEEKQLDPIP